MIIIQTTRAIKGAAVIWIAPTFYSEIPIGGFAQCKWWWMRNEPSESE